MTFSFPSKINVTARNVDISSLTSTQKDYYINLFEEVISLYSSFNKNRAIIGFAGPSGSGKSTALAILKELSKQIDLSFEIVTLGIDAYSYTNNFLLTHYDKNKPLKDYKGRFDTYDLEKLKSDLEHFINGKDISLPEYSRKIHEPIENSIFINEKRTLLLVEGLWLLYDKNCWDEIGKLLDYSIFIIAQKEKVRETTINRHISGGRSKNEASKYYDEVDFYNFDIVTKTKEKADKIIPLYSNIIN